MPYIDPWTHPVEYADWREEHDNGDTTLSFLAWMAQR